MITSIKTFRFVAAGPFLQFGADYLQLEVFFVVWRGEGSLVWDGPKPYERKREGREND